MSNYDHNSIEISNVLHTLLTPFRWLIAFIKWSALLLAVFSLLAYNWTAWIVGYGNHGLYSRQEISDQIAHSTNSSVWDVDFTHREMAGEGPNLGIAYTNYEPDKPALAAFRAVAVSSSGTGGEPIFCQDSDSATSRVYLDTDKGSWTDRSNSAFVRKSARMQQDYTSAALMISDLRYTLTMMKLNQDVIIAYYLLPSERSTMTLDPHCEVDAPTLEKGVTPEAALQWVTTSNSVIIPDAPQIRLRLINPIESIPYFFRPGSDSDYTVQQRYLISGMCLQSECSSEDLNYFTTKYADLFDAAPPLSPHQVDAERALLATATDAFWVRTARENGFHTTIDLNYMRRVAATFRNIRDNAMWPDPAITNILQGGDVPTNYYPGLWRGVGPSGETPAEQARAVLRYQQNQKATRLYQQSQADGYGQ